MRTSRESDARACVLCVHGSVKSNAPCGVVAEDDEGDDDDGEEEGPMMLPLPLPLSMSSIALRRSMRAAETFFFIAISFSRISLSSNACMRWWR